MGYTVPTGIVLESSQIDDISIVKLEFKVKISEPSTPAGLYLAPNSGSEIFQLHRSIKNEKSIVTFATFDWKASLPKVEHKYYYLGWWIPDANEAVLDVDEKWEKKEYPDNGDHDHCLFTWKTISSYKGEKYGYYSEKYGWITEDSYKQYIRDDIYHLRRVISI